MCCALETSHDGGSKIPAQWAHTSFWLDPRVLDFKRPCDEEDWHRDVVAVSTVAQSFHRACCLFSTIYHARISLIHSKFPSYVLVCLESNNWCA
jgi:hypothetical protein